MCALISCNSICLLCITISGVHSCIGMLYGGRCPVVVGVLSSGGGMVVVGAEMACCLVAVSGGAFGCTGTPCRIVTCAGNAIVASFALP